jgi:hypothetical protein
MGWDGRRQLGEDWGELCCDDGLFLLGSTDLAARVRVIAMTVTIVQLECRVIWFSMKTARKLWILQKWFL